MSAGTTTLDRLDVSKSTVAEIVAGLESGRCTAGDVVRWFEMSVIADFGTVAMALQPALTGAQFSACLSGQGRVISATAQANAQRQGGRLTFKVSAKGGVSVYGLGRFPVTLYASQWGRLFGFREKLEAFIQFAKGEEHDVAEYVDGKPTGKTVKVRMSEE